MARPKVSVPAYSRHVASGQACVYIDRKRVYLGTFNSPESRQRYAEILQKLSAGLPVGPARTERVAPSSTARLTVNELALAFLLHAQDEYRDKATGKPSAEFDCYRSCLKPLRELFGETAAADFGPNALRTVRERFIANGWCRGFVNREVNRVRHVWRWAVAREMVPSSTLEGLRALEPLKPGKSSAPESKRRTAVSDEHIDAVRPHLSQQCRDAFDLLRLTGARPSELLNLTTGQIDRSGPVWVATLTDHKNAHRGLDRKLYFGPQAQLILKRRLSADPDARLFNLRRDYFSQAVGHACIKANVPRFTPYHLRHSLATSLRDKLGIESAQATLGHAKPDMTAHYSAKLDAKAIEAAARFG